MEWLHNFIDAIFITFVTFAIPFWPTVLKKQVTYDIYSSNVINNICSKLMLIEKSIN